MYLKEPSYHPLIYGNRTDCILLLLKLHVFRILEHCVREGEGGEEEEENSKTWLDPTDLESLVSTTCRKKFPTKHYYIIAAANNN